MTAILALVVTLSWLTGCGGWSGGEGESGTTIVTAVLAEGLNNPTAVIVGSDGSLLVAESGAGRVVAIDADGVVTPVVTGFDLGSFTPYDIGPLSLIQSSDGGLIVGEGGNPTGQDAVSFYGPEGTPAFEALVPVGGGDYYGLALQASTGNLLIASAGTDRIFGAPPAESGGFSEAEVIIDDTSADPISATAPTALAFDADGLLYVGFAGEGSSKIVSIDTATSFVETVTNSDTSVTGIAFRLSDSALFFTVLGEAERSSGAVFDIGTNGVAAEFVGGLAGPTALAFDSADALYVTTLGTSPNAAAGQLLKITVQEIVEEEPSDGESSAADSTNDNES